MNKFLQRYTLYYTYGEEMKEKLNATFKCPDQGGNVVLASADYDKFLTDTVHTTMHFNWTILEQCCKHGVYDRNLAFSKEALYTRLEQVDIPKGRHGIIKQLLQKFNIKKDLPQEAQPRDVSSFFHAQ